MRGSRVSGSGDQGSALLVLGDQGTPIAAAGTMNAGAGEGILWVAGHLAQLG
jgi:hypothetical protein